MSYESNKLIDLKREAVIARDVDTLSHIRQFEKENLDRVFYYKRITEDIIRDQAGAIIDNTPTRDENGKITDYGVLGIPEPKVWEILWCIEFSKILTNYQGEPGSLMRDINERPGYRDLTKIILEVPDDTAFPIPPDFDWLAVCDQYLKSPGYIPADRRLDGHRFFKVLHYLKAKPYDQGLTLVSIDKLENEDIDQIIGNYIYDPGQGEKRTPIP